jgi:K+-sensing histidine kinase KdpD
VERSIAKLTRRIEGAPINWADYSEAAHALRGPLNSTIGFSRLMLKELDGPLTDAQKEALQTVHNTGRRLLVLFNLVLDSLYVIGNELIINVESFELGQLLEELITTGKTLAKGGGFDFKPQVAAGVTQATVSSDTRRLKQAITALLAISIKYRGDGAVVMRAWLSEDKLLIQLESPEWRLPAIFLTDLSSLLTREADHSLPYDAHLRLGLAWRMLREMDADLQARQVDGKGTFTVTLPTVPRANG